MGQVVGISTNRTHCRISGGRGGKDTIELHSLRAHRMRLRFVIEKCVEEVELGRMIAQFLR